MTQVGTTLKLPEYVNLSLAAQDAVTILGALQNSDGPFKAISAAINAVQSQLVAQAAEPPGALPVSAGEEVAHHPV